MNNTHPHKVNLKSAQSSLISSEISSILPLDFSIKHILLCPNCHIRIPLISKIMSDSEMKIIFNCLCSNSSKEMSLIDYFTFLSKLTQNQQKTLCIEHNNPSNETYCSDCNEWLCQFCLQSHQLKYNSHFISNKEIIIDQYCNIHKDKHLNLYCEECLSEVCEMCLSDYHLNHKVIRTSQYLTNNARQIQFKTETDLFYQFNAKIAYYDNIKDQRISEIKEMIEQLNRIIQETEKEYMTTLIKNIYLLGLIEIVYSQVFNDERIPNTNSMNNIHYFVNAFDVNIIDFSTYDHIKKLICDNISKLNQETCNLYQRDLLFEYQQTKFDAKAFTLGGHTDWVKCLAQISDNQIVSCSYDKTIKVWNLTQQKCTKTLKGHKDWIRKVIYLDRNIIASCSDDTTIKVWNVSLDEHIVSVQAHNKPVYSIIKLKKSINNSSCTNNSNGAYTVASSSEDLSIKIWNVMKKELLFALEGHSAIVSTLDQLNDGRIVSGSWDKTIRIWNLNKTHCDSILNGHSKYVHCVIVVAPETIASSGEDKLIKIWDITNSTCLTNLIGHCDGVLHLIKLHDGRLVSCSMDKTIKFWNVSKETAVSSIVAHNYSVRFIIQLKNGKIASCSDDLFVKVWC